MQEADERLIREAVRAFNKRDIDGIVATVHADAEIELVGGFADVMGTQFQGPDGVRRFYTDWFATFKTMHLEVERTLEAGDRLLTLTKLRATVEGSDSPVEVLGAITYVIVDGKVRRAGLYYNRSEALEAAGLREPV